MRSSGGAGTGRSLTAAQLAQRRAAARSLVTHGGRSKNRVTRCAGYRKQALLVPLGIRQADLSHAGRFWLDRWSIAAAEVFLMERHICEHGLIDEDGGLPGFTSALYAARNHMARMFVKLEPLLLEAVERKAGAGSMVLRMQRNGNERR